jgi:hypothetical protein
MDKKGHQINRENKNSSPLKDIGHVLNEWVAKLLPHKQDHDNSEQGNQNQESNNPRFVNADAVFIGWQKIPSGDVFPLYNVTAKNHPLYHSTVSDQTLRKQNLKIPQTPPLKER